MHKISVVIPAFNEEKNLESVVRQTASVLEELCGRQYEIIIVDDGSRDLTPSIIEGLQKENPSIKKITHAKNEGMGACYRDGFALSQGDWISVLPADGQISPADLKKFAAAMKDADCVTSFYTEKQRGLFRDVMSGVVRLMLFVLFGPHPRLEGIYMFDRKILQDIHLISSSFVFNFEVIVKAHRWGYRVKEIGITCLPRLSGRSKVVRFKKIIHVAFEIIRWRIKG